MDRALWFRNRFGFRCRLRLLQANPTAGEVAGSTPAGAERAREAIDAMALPIARDRKAGRALRLLAVGTLVLMPLPSARSETGGRHSVNLIV